jgi:hypothetical protein
MSLYVHPDNQQLLWNLISSNQLLSNLFVNHSPYQKEQFFRNVIETFYEQHKNKEIDKMQLQQLNRDTLSHIIFKLSNTTVPDQQRLDSQRLDQQRLDSQRLDQQRLDQQRLDSQRLDQQRPESINATSAMSIGDRSDVFARQLNERQRDFDAMLAKKTPPEVDFREKPIDYTTSNMDQLIKQHQTDREKDFNYSSLPVAQLSPPKLIITNDSPSNIKFEAELVKSVSWADTEFKDILNSQTTEIGNLKVEIGELRTVIWDLSDKIIKILGLLQPPPISQTSNLLDD